ncbi:unnamed protein product [Pleuronectes platessa]|uniref:Uncharacterized protein n=1 Tax=Pleuronectes platessa TaxID=8262 RepID=A0A9N7VRY2_PLEPL|nr:unnamed protein product [Pleuronectes platessa]
MQSHQWVLGLPWGLLPVEASSHLEHTQKNLQRKEPSSILIRCPNHLNEPLAKLPLDVPAPQTISEAASSHLTETNSDLAAWFHDFFPSVATQSLRRNETNSTHIFCIGYSEE